MLVAGIMSGTSLDGIDAALVDLVPRGDAYAARIVRGQTTAFDAALRERIELALPPNAPSPAQVAALDAEVGAAIADAVFRAAAGSTLDFVASHGLTLFHDGGARVTVQIGDPFVIRSRIDTTVLADFRRADCAEGGCGAPLVPYVDALLYGHPVEDRVLLNLGGIANFTFVRAGSLAPIGWDTGPANMALDAFVRDRTRGDAAFDRDGAAARAGIADPSLLARLLDDPYFAAPPPKSTGRERFGAAFLAPHAAALAALSLEDGCATLAALSVETIARDIERVTNGFARVIVTGGGAHNLALLRGLRERLPQFAIDAGGALGIDVDFKEALAFAVLGYELLRGRAANVPLVTGARRHAVLGSIVPHDLDALLAKMDRELAAKDA